MGSLNKKFKEPSQSMNVTGHNHPSWELRCTLFIQTAKGFTTIGSMRAHGSRSLKKERSKAMACNSCPNYQWFEILVRDVRYYGMGLLGSVPPKNATKTTRVRHHFVRWQWVFLVPVPKCKRLWEKD
jgi:hypothetical protein